MSEKLKPYIVDTSLVWGPDKIEWNPAAMSGLSWKIILYDVMIMNWIVINDEMRF